MPKKKKNDENFLNDFIDYDKNSHIITYVGTLAGENFTFDASLKMFYYTIKSDLKLIQTKEREVF